MALLNTRSLVNKSFVVNDFFLASRLDVLFLTETWIRPGESSSFSELLPLDCAFFNSPRTAGRGGGLASVFRSKFRVRQLPPALHSSFEVQLLELSGSSRTLCAVVYRPPKRNKDFIREFADLLGIIFLSYDRVLICGDFNIHICCEEDLLAKDFLALIDSFNITQWVRKSTHIKGHMLDLVLSYGLDICITDINDAGISDHFPVIFDVQSCNMELNSEGPPSLSRPINSEAVALFSAAFANSFCYEDISNAPLSVDGVVNSFISICTSILDTVAPVKIRRRKTSRQPWLNESILALRRECRRAERRWKKDQLQVSLDILHMSRSKFQKAAKMAKTSFLSNIIANNSHNPRVLFKIFNSVVNPCSDVSMGASPALCEKFLNFWI
ncbi:uncharacterized protein LOC106632421 [Haplochromis burtoni]|uniref:uncharacterized protein LOC106632421 n=1 Tax=Haplochromis burtoni TaxID=8153 RepID=UPI001C2D26A0|nr:uncharacterized protein LOC106632421 [Haplochromis burtoni]